MELYLIRHGQSAYNIGLTEDLDSGLTPLGQAQADRTGRRMAGEGLTHAYTSPLRRALETVGPLCADAGLRAEVVPEVVEYFSETNDAYRTFRGRRPDEITGAHPHAFFGADPAGGVWWPQTPEDNARLSARVERARDGLLRRHGGTDHRIVVVSHADTVVRLMEAFLRAPSYPDAPPHPGSPQWVDNASVTRLTVGPDPTAAATLVYANDTSHLAGLAP